VPPEAHLLPQTWNRSDRATAVLVFEASPTSDEVGDHLLPAHDSGALIGKIKKGERFPSLALARRLDVALDTGGALEQLWPQVEHERATRDTPGDGPVREGGPGAGDLGLAWSATAHATVEVVAELWRSELDRRSVLVSAAWVTSAFTEPTREWLLNREDEVAQGGFGRHVGQNDIDALWEMCATFTNVDQRLGGGYARSPSCTTSTRSCSHSSKVATTTPPAGNSWPRPRGYAISVGLDRHRVEAVGQALTGVLGLCSMTAAGLARRVSERQWTMVERGVARVSARMLARVARRRREALMRSVTIDRDTTDVEERGLRSW
jgi:hypothetical protein